MTAQAFRFGVEERPPALQLLIYAAQWVAFATYPLMFSLVLLGLGWNLEGPVLGKFIAATLWIIGLGSLLQAFLGHALCMMSGPFVLTIFAMLESHRAGHDFGSIFGALALSGAIVALLAATRLVGRIRPLFTPLVIGTLVMMIGLSSAPFGIRLMVGQGAGAGLVAFGLALLCGFIALRLRGFIATVPVIVVVTLGYLLFRLLPGWWLVQVPELPWISPPRPALLGLRWPPLGLLILFTFVQLATAAFGMGATLGVSAAVRVRRREGHLLRQAIINSLGEGTLAALLSAAPLVGYPGSLGFVSMTSVASRWAMAAGGALLVVLSSIGPLSALLAAIPRPVAGAVLLAIAGMNIGLGAEIWGAGTARFTKRHAFTVGFAIFCALGFTALPPESLRGMPNVLALILRNPVLSAMIFVIVLDGLVFRSSPPPTAAPDTSVDE